MKPLINLMIYLLLSWCFSCDKDKTENGEIVIEESTPLTDYDGNTYKTVRIGDQIWMAENLKTTRYSDGTAIPSLVYNNNDSNLSKFGRLYTWTAAMRNSASSSTNPSNVQGVSPVGWHIPSEAEWMELINNLGGASTAGGKMKSTSTDYWLSPNTGASNESLLNVLPSGFYRFDGVFMKMSEWAIFLTSNTSSPITIMTIKYDRASVAFEQWHPSDVVSVRCVKD